MHDVVLQQTVFWIWLVMAVAAFLFVGFIFIKFLLDGEDRDAVEVSLLEFVLLTSMGQLYTALLCLGHPATALWSWQILSCIVAVSGAGILIRVRVKTPLSGWKPLEQLAFAGVTLLGIFIAAASFFAHPAGPATSSGQGTTLPAIASWLTADHVNKLASAGALFLLAMLTLYAGFYFLRAVQQRGTLSIERNDAGIGGSSSMWEISPALTFLAAMLLFGTLFTVLLFHEEGRVTEAQKHGEEQTKAVSVPAAPVPASAQPALPSSAPATSAPHTTTAEVPAASSH